MSRIQRLALAAASAGLLVVPFERAHGRAAADGDLRKHLDPFVRVEIVADLSVLPASEMRALSHLIEASRLMDRIFIRQAGHRNAELERVWTGDLAELFHIHKGRFDRLTGEPFFGRGERPEGAGYYPEDMSVAEFRSWIEAHPEDREAFQSLFTVIRRHAGGLVAIPYSRYFREWLEPAARELRLAAAETENESLRRFLLSRAEAFRTDDYYRSDMDWMDLDSALEITIGPYETYEDGLLGYKAAFESFVTVSDPEASRALALYKSELPAMERNLPIPDEMKTERGTESPIRVVDVVFTAGDARTGVQTIAFNLPNDERVREAKGSKKVLLRNVIEAKYEAILRPIAEILLAPDQVDLVTARAFTDQTLFHELSHGLGPGRIVIDGRETEVRLELKELYSPLEEAKADIMGVWSLLFMMKKGVVAADRRQEAEATWLAGLFRSIRFGVEEAHGKANAIQFNYMLAQGAVVRREDGRFAIDPERFESGCASLVREICLLQGRGDYEGTKRFFERYASVDDALMADLARIAGVPVDIRPVYAFDPRG